MYLEVTEVNEKGRELLEILDDKSQKDFFEKTMYGSRAFFNLKDFRQHFKNDSITEEDVLLWIREYTQENALDDGRTETEQILCNLKQFIGRKDAFESRYIGPMYDEVKGGIFISFGTWLFDLSYQEPEKGIFYSVSVDNASGIHLTPGSENSGPMFESAVGIFINTTPYLLELFSAQGLDLPKDRTFYNVSVDNVGVIHLTPKK